MYIVRDLLRTTYLIQKIEWDTRSIINKEVKFLFFWFRISQHYWTGTCISTTKHFRPKYVKDRGFYSENRWYDVGELSFILIIWSLTSFVIKLDNLKVIDNLRESLFLPYGLVWSSRGDLYRCVPNPPEPTSYNPLYPSKDVGLLRTWSFRANLWSSETKNGKMTEGW